MMAATPTARRWASGLAIRGPPARRLADRDAHRLRERDPRRGPTWAAARHNRARWGCHCTHGRCALGTKVEGCGDRVCARLLRCLHRPHDLAFGKLLRGQVGLLIEDEGTVKVLLEARGPAIYPLSLFLTVAAPDFRSSHDHPAIAVEGPSLEA